MPVKNFESICKKEKSRHRLLPGLPGLENERGRTLLRIEGFPNPVRQIL